MDYRACVCVCACVTGQDVGCNAIFFFQIYFSHMTHRRQLPFAPEAQPAAIVIGIHVFFTSIFLFVFFAVVFPFQAILPGANPCQSSGISCHQTPKAPPISSVRYQLKCQARAGTAAAQLTRADC